MRRNREAGKQGYAPRFHGSGGRHGVALQQKQTGLAVAESHWANTGPTLGQRRGPNRSLVPN